MPPLANVHLLITRCRTAALHSRCHSCRQCVSP